MLFTTPVGLFFLIFLLFLSIQYSHVKHFRIRRKIMERFIEKGNQKANTPTNRLKAYDEPAFNAAFIAKTKQGGR